MPQTEAKISALRCEPYIADRPDCPDGYHGPPELILWRVFVDEVCVASEAMPFDALDAVLELRANKCVPIFSDGDDYVSVRMLDDKVFWFGFHLAFLYTHMPNYDGTALPTDFIYVFDASQYQQAIEDAQIRLPQNNPHVKLAPKPPPHLTTVELSDVLRNLYPRDLDLPLYRMPELESDRRGAELFRAVWNVINAQQVKLSVAPTSAIEVRIVLDAEVFVESVWQVGRIGDDIAILFEIEPHFPLWLGGFGTIARWIPLP
jgi:hypothetical protein